LCIIYSNNEFQIGKVCSKTAFSLAAHWELTGSSQGARRSCGYVIEYIRKIEYKRRKNNYMMKINGINLLIDGD
jgi:hypothetical protein